MVKTNPKFNNMKIEDLVNHPQFKANEKYDFIDNIVDDMVNNSTGRHDFIDNIIDDMFDDATDNKIDYEIDD